MEFERQKHLDYILNLDKASEQLEYHYTLHLRLSGIYWATTSLALLKELDKFDKETVIKNVLDCYHPSVGGFGGHPTHDPHLLFTLSAIQVLVTFDALSRVDTTAVINYVKSLQNEDGSFAGDQYGEIDTRFSYCAVSIASLLNSLEAINTKSAVEYVLRCMNHDGGFGSVPGAESHAGQRTLAILDSLHLVDGDALGWWLCERQLPNGGLNGRPEKLEDVCYSWWVLSSLQMLGRDHWIDKPKLREFIKSSQDVHGGFADRPGDISDIFHTLFGICGLGMCGEEGIAKVDPRYCMPVDVISNHFNKSL